MRAGGFVIQPHRFGGQFRALWLAEAVSTAGDQLAKVAISIVVFARTGSASYAAGTYALALLPSLIAGPLLAPAADRYPRRTVMIVCAGAQTVLAAVMAVFVLVPVSAVTAVAVLAGCVVGIALAVAPARAARDGVVVEVLAQDAVRAGQRSLGVIREIGQLAGLVGAAAVVELVGPAVAMAADAVSFMIAGLAVGCWVRAGLVPPNSNSAVRRVPRREAVRLLMTDRRLRVLLAMAALIAVTIVPDALIAPLVRQLGAPNGMVGVLLACDCVGFVLAGQVQRWWSARTERAALGPLLIASLASLAGFVAHPGLAVACVLLVVSGAGATYLPLTSAEVSLALPDRVRGTGMGIARTVVVAGQGLGVLVAGVVADRIGSASAVIGWSALSALVPAVVLAWAWARANTAPNKTNRAMGADISEVAVASHGIPPGHEGVDGGTRA